MEFESWVPSTAAEVLPSHAGECKGNYIFWTTGSRGLVGVKGSFQFLT